MRRRLDLAASMMSRPPVLFLDEPTTGLDPTSRLRMWEIIQRAGQRHGVTLLLTTQYLDEADSLADDIVVIDHGRVIAQGTPRQLKAASKGARVDVTLSGPHPDALGALAPLVDEARYWSVTMGATSEAPGSTTRPDWPRPSSAPSMRPGCWSTTSRCASPPWTTSSSD